MTLSAETQPATSHADRRFVCGLLLCLILAGSFLLKLNHLGHRSIKALDESFHALVAKNLLKHPLTPTLYDKPWLAYDYRDWQSNHVWLHKPIVPLWQMALSMAVFGTNTFAMRLPSALLATLAVWLTYAIGRDLLRDRRPALIAAALQAFNPAITSIVHGYVFSDHIDVAFLFWTELAVWCLVRATGARSTRWLIAAGVAQGVAFLCKTYPAFIVTGIAIVAMLLSQLRPRQLLILLAATTVTIAPWTLWCVINFPREFAWEQLQVFRHLGTNVEQWAAPWDRLIFDFSLRIYHLFYPAVIVAAVVLALRAKQERILALCLLLAWGVGVLVPHTLAVSKTPTATLIGWPPFLILLGVMIVRAIDGDIMCLAAWFVSSLLAAIAPGTILQQGWGYPDPPRFAGIMLANLWVAWHVLAALAIALLASLPLRDTFLRSRRFLLVIASLATLFLFSQTTRIAWKITQLNRNEPSFENVARIANSLPENAVLLMELREKGEHIIAMFAIDRGIYPVTRDTFQQRIRQVTDAGGIPYLLINRSAPLTPVHPEFLDGLRLYALPARPANP